MKKKLLARALALVMAMSLLSTTAFAASFEDLSAAINGDGDTSNNYIEETGRYGYGWNDNESRYGIEAWDEDGTRNVQLQEDVTGDKNNRIIIGDGQNVNLDLNNQTVTSEHTQAVTVEQGGELTVTDSGEDGNITANGTYTIVNKGTLNLDGGSINGESKYGVYTTGTTTIAEDVNVHGGTYGAWVTAGGSLETAGNITGSYGVLGNGENVSVEVTGGTVTGTTEGIRMQKGSDVSIKGGTVSGEKYGVAVSDSTADILGGKVDGKIYGVYVFNGGEATIGGDAFVTSNQTGVFVTGTGSKLNIEGGTIQGNNNAISIGEKVYNSIEEAAAADSDMLSITGGTLTNVKEIKEVKADEIPQFEGYITRKAGLALYLRDIETEQTLSAEDQKKLIDECEFTYSYVIDGIQYVSHDVEKYYLDSNVGFRLYLPIPEDGRGQLDISLTITHGYDVIIADLNGYTTNDYQFGVEISDELNTFVDGSGREVESTDGKPININSAILTCYFQPTYTVTVNYVDEDGNPVAEAVFDETVRYRDGASYSITSPEVDGYTADQTVVSGEIDKGNVVVTVVYKSNSVPVDPVDPEQPGETEQPTDPTEPTTPDEPGTIITDPDIPLAGGADEDLTTILDDEVPLAGLLTLAELLEELRQQEGIEDVELPEDFQWIDHEYAQAIYWGLEEGLVVDTEESPLDPDEALTVGLMREVLTNYVDIYKEQDGVTVVLEGEDEDLIMDYVDMIARISAIYEEPEAAPEDTAA